MTPKRVRYTVHAARRLRERRITRREVRAIMATGERVKATTLAGAQRWESRGMIGPREVSVVYIESAAEIDVITVYFRS